VLCRTCAASLARSLATAASIAEDLDDAVARLLKRGTGGGKRSGDDNPLPIDTGAMDVRDQLHNCLSGWVRVLIETGRNSWTTSNSTSTPSGSSSTCDASAPRANGADSAATSDTSAAGSASGTGAQPGTTSTGTSPSRSGFPAANGGTPDAGGREQERNGTSRAVTSDGAAAWPADTIASMAAWLAVRSRSIRQHEAAADIHDEVTSAVARAASVVDRKPDKVGAGECDLCGAQMWADGDADSAVCERCEAVVVSGVRDRRRQLVANADVLGSPPELSGALKHIGVKVSAGTIRMWASRGRLAQRPGGVYAMSDVMHLAARRTA
jgi:hypothetical protein